MKTKKSIIYTCLAVSFISILIMIILFWCTDTNQKLFSLLLNICYGIFGGAIITTIITYKEYKS